MKNIKNKISSKTEDFNIENLTVLNKVKTPKSFKVFAYTITFLFISFITIIIFTPWQQTISGFGKVIAYTPLERQQNVQTPIKGKIVKWYVSEGIKVKKEQPLAEISDIDPEYFNRLKQQKELLLQSLLAYQEKSESYKSQIDFKKLSRDNAVLSAQSKINMTEDKLKAEESKLIGLIAENETAKLNIERQKALFEKGLTSKRNLELTELKLRKTDSDIENSKAYINALKDEIESLKADKIKVSSSANAEIDLSKAYYNSALSDIAKIKSDITKIDIDISRQNSRIVKSPQNGTILKILAFQDGNVLKEGDYIATIVPDTNQKAVELWVNGNDVPLVTISENARLQFEGWPALQFSGWPSIAVGTFGGKVALVDSTDNGEGLFRVVIIPDNQNEWPENRYLRQGVRTKGWIIINQVQLWYEIWRQFNGFPPVIKTNDKNKKSYDDVIKIKSK